MTTLYQDSIIVLYLKYNLKQGGVTVAITMKAARVNAGYTQKEAAKALEISKNTLIGYEMGRVVPKSNTAQKMAELYGLSVNDIIFFAN